MNIFEDRKTRERFAEICEFLPKVQRDEFSRRVKALFDKKSVSEDGEFDMFKITVEDLNAIMKSMKAAV